MRNSLSTLFNRKLGLKRFVIAIASVLLASSIDDAATAAETCVLAGDAPAFQAALDTAASNGQDDVIMLQAGDYDLTAAPTLSYLPGAEQHDLTIVGGYFADPESGDPCGGIQSLDARDTVIEGGKEILLAMPSGVGSITLSTFTIASMVSSGKPVVIGAPAGATGDLTVDKMIFKQNGSSGDTAVSLEADSGALIVANSVFDQNISLASYNAVRIHNRRPDDSLCIEITQSTFARNATSVPAVGLGGDGLSEPCAPLVIDSVFWGNSTGQLQVNWPAVGIFFNDDVGDLSELDGMDVSDTISVDPLFAANLSLSDMSPLRDAGLVSGLIPNGTYDVTGSQRIYGSMPDIGAFEIQDVIFAHPFDWQLPP
jgi:hypothetical protein